MILNIDVKTLITNVRSIYNDDINYNDDDEDLYADNNDNDEREYLRMLIVILKTDRHQK